MGEPFLCLGGCGRRLTAPESRAIGYGPTCRERHGIRTAPGPRIPAPAHHDHIPGQEAIPLVNHQPTLWSL